MATKLAPISVFGTRQQFPEELTCMYTIMYHNMGIGFYTCNSDAYEIISYLYIYASQ